MPPRCSPSSPVARIDLSALVHNFSEVRRLIAAGSSESGVEVLAMVKADAYGHGAVAVAEALGKAGCCVFGVATLAEAEAVAGSGRRVVVFGGIDPSEAADAVEMSVEVVTDNMTVVGELSRAATPERPAQVHLKVDTGMHRLGVHPADGRDFVAKISADANLRLVGVCSHFAMAESVDTPVTDGQIERLRALADLLEGPEKPTFHMANSAAVMTNPSAHFDMVRPGLMLYGLYPDRALADAATLKPVMTFESTVVHVATVEAGEGIGYGHTFRTPSRMKIATLRCGYADGYPRILGNRGVVSVNGKSAEIVGRVCMDHTMIDVSADESVSVGDRAVMWGTEPATERIAELAETITYELVARVGSRVTRVYEAGE